MWHFNKFAVMCPDPRFLQALDDGAASAVGMLLADLAGASEGGKASAFGLQVGVCEQRFQGFWGDAAATFCRTF